jgi:hypothetical protein
LGSILVEWCVRPAILTSNAAIIIQGPSKYFGQDYAIPSAMLIMAGLAWAVYWMSISFIYRYATVANNRLSMLIFSQRAAAFAGVFGAHFVKQTIIRYFCRIQEFLPVY